MAPVWPLWAWCRLASLGITPSAAGGNINPPVGRRLVGAHGQQLARLEVGQRSGCLCVCVECVLRCPPLALTCARVYVCAHLWASLTLCMQLYAHAPDLSPCASLHAAACSGRWREDPDHKQTRLSRDESMTKYWLALLNPI